MPTLDKEVEQSSWMMSSVMELNPTLQTVHTSPITTVAILKMLESDVLVSTHSLLALVAATSLTAAKNGGIQSRTMLNEHIITKTSCHIYKFVTITIKDAK